MPPEWTLSLEQRIGLGPVPGGRGHVIFGTRDLSLQGFDAGGQLVLAERIEVLPAQQNQGIVRPGGEEFVIHGPQR